MELKDIERSIIKKYRKTIFSPFIKAIKEFNLIEENDKEFTWLKNNAHKYGFILRYQKNAEKITGYIYEPWHYRYVGTELASYIYSNNITYDEYIARNK